VTKEIWDRYPNVLLIDFLAGGLQAIAKDQDLIPTAQV